MKKNFDKTLSRLAAIQSCFQSFFDQKSLKNLEIEFNTHRFNKTLDQNKFKMKYDKALYKDLISYIENFKSNFDINEYFEKYIKLKRPFKRLDIITKVILIVGTSEILSNQKINKKIIINEYINISKSFLDKPEVSMINAILDKIYDNRSEKKIN
tara:strand:- start:19 stop:483 length:465 start_codon:yes stop_codon:yes gene_type:complete